MYLDVPDRKWTDQWWTDQWVSFTPRNSPFISRWKNLLILTIDPNFQRDIQVWLSKGIFRHNQLFTQRSPYCTDHKITPIQLVWHPLSSLLPSASGLGVGFGYLNTEPNRVFGALGIMFAGTLLANPDFPFELRAPLNLSNAMKTNLFISFPGCTGPTNEQWKRPWLVGLYRGLYYPVI